MSAVEQQPFNLDGDLESSGSSEEQAASPVRMSPLRVGVVAIGFAVVASCCAAVLYLRSVAPAASLGGSTSARALLESPEMVDEATTNFVTWSDGKLRDEPRLRKRIQSGLAKITARIQRENPEMFQRLEARQLSPAEKGDVLKVVAGMRHPGVQSLGRALAETVSASRAEGREGLKKKLHAQFGSKMHSLRQLQEEVFPESLRRASKDVSDSQLFLNVEKMLIVKQFPDSWKAGERRLAYDSFQAVKVPPVDISDDPKDAGSILESDDLDLMAEHFEEALGIIAGLLEQSRVALDQVDLVGEGFGKDMKIPYQAKSAVGALDFVTELADCVMRADNNEVKLVMCPMKYASAAADALEAIDNIMGIDNGKLEANAQTQAAQHTQQSGWAAQYPTQAPAWNAQQTQQSAQNVWR
eukprot:TRINITY_DN518_c0_g1_i1.p1 TRINITY_DN518_c0_g1~~TRINITY_DN518_c0_g1_i1.p1  ORF type:complete len:413 (-),score=114.05 TRINITY_DN518_c0_g1_i1:197-1435(-)